MFTIGKIIGSEKNLEINLPYLIKSRMLIQANSGAGKSYCVRKLLEETHGKVQQIVIDLDGEFSTLREKFDYLLVGNEGDIPADIRSSELLAKKLLENNISAIIDLSELKHHERILFVKKFLDSMVNSKRELWHPCLVIVDEAHQFCPEKGKAESASSVIDLATRGRKRGYCIILATQRLSKIHKDAVAECNNKLIGRTSLDIDMKRASEELGFTSKEQMRSLRMLEAGEFYAYGSAMTSNEIQKVKIGKVKTTHPEPGTANIIAPKPATEKMKKILAKLADLPKKAEEELKEKSDFQTRIRELKMQLRKASTSKDFKVPTQKEKEVQRIASEQLTLNSKMQGFREAESIYKVYTTQLINFCIRLQGSLSSVSSLAMKAHDRVIPELPKGTDKYIIKQGWIKEKWVKSEKGYSSHPVATIRKKENSPLFNDMEEQPEEQPKLRTGAMNVLKAIAVFPEPVTKQQVSTLVGYKMKGGTFNTYLSELKKIGWVEENNKKLSITITGLENAGDTSKISTDPTELIEFWANKFRTGAGNILRIIAERYPHEITKEELAELTNTIITGGTFNTYLSDLKRNNLIKIEGNSIKATKTLFLEE